MADVISRNKTTPKMLNHKKSPKKTPRRPVTPGKGKAITGKDLWMAALKKRQTLILPNTYRPGSPRHKTPTEYFIDTLRKTGVGISAETNKSHNMTGLKGSNIQYPYLSTSHYMRQVMGTEKLLRTADDSSVRVNVGTPAYKTQEEYYDEVLALRKQIAALTFEGATHKTKIRRLEEENAKKEKEIDGLLNPEKNAELRRTMGDRQADAGAIVHSLKQKILKLEMQLRDKESSFCKLQADLKSTKVEEMRVQLETLYAELMRLQLSKDTGSDKSKSTNNSTAKIKALNETVIRLSRSNEQLQAENKSLKEDLDKALQDTDVKIDTKKEYEDMNRTELLLVIADLEKRLDQIDGDRTSLLSQESSHKLQGKIELRGSVEDRLQQLDQRETELLDEVTKLKTVVRRSREEKKKIDDTTSLPPTPRRRQSKQIDDDRGSRPSSARQSSRRASSVSRDDRIESIKKYQGPSEEESQNAGIKIRTVRKETDTNKKVKAFRENRAAKKLQHSWLDYKHRQYDEEMDNAAFTIQEALKGSRARHQRMQHWASEEYDSGSSVTDDGVYLIQSSLKGHRNRQQKLKQWRNMNTDDDEDSVISSGRRRNSPPYRSPSIQQQVSTRRPSSGGQSDRRPSSGGQSDRRPSSGGQSDRRPSSGGQLVSDRRPSSGGQSVSDRRLSSGGQSVSNRRLSSAQRPTSATKSKRGSVSSQTFKAKYDVPGPSHATDSNNDDDDDDIMF